MVPGRPLDHYYGCHPCLNREVVSAGELADCGWTCLLQAESLVTGLARVYQ